MPTRLFFFIITLCAALLLTEVAPRFIRATATGQNAVGQSNSPNPRDNSEQQVLHFRQKRLPDGEEELPADRYLMAREQMRGMQTYSTAQNRLLPAGETNIEANWTELGPGNIGGRTRAMVIHPADPNTMFAGASSGGVWKTTDGGASWKPLTDMLANLAVNALAIDRGNPNILYAGTGEGFYNTGSLRGAGIFKSADGGANWVRLESTFGQDFYYVNKIIISPNNSQRLYAATRAGVWRSGDGGSTWARVLDPQVSSGCLDLAIRTDQSNDFVFASCGTLGQSTVYRNTDAGGAGAWDVVLRETGMGRTSLAIAPSNQNIVYASSASLAFNTQPGLFAVFRSANSGEANSWTAQVRGNDTNKLNTALFSWTRDAFLQECKLGPSRLFNTGWYANSIAVDPSDANRVWVGGVDLFRSDDGGANWGLASYSWLAGSWLDAGAPQYAHNHHHQILFHPQFDGATNKTMFVSGDGGVYKTDDARATVATGATAPCDASQSAVRWVSLNHGYGATKFYHGAPLPDGKSYIGGADGQGFLLGSDEAGVDGWKNILGTDGGFVAIDQLNPNNIYTATGYNLIRKSSDGGRTFAYVSRGLDPSGFLYIAPLVADPSDGRRLWTGGQGLWRTTDGGAHWSEVIRMFQSGSFSAIAVSPTDSNVVAAGTNLGGIYLFSNALSQPSPSSGFPRFAVPRSGYVSWVAFDPVETNIVYATYSTFGDKHVWRSVDGGANWTDIDGAGAGALPDLPVLCIAVDPNNRQRLFIGTDAGVFVSTDGGASWAVERGLPNVSTEALAINTTTTSTQLFAFTFGRGAWRVDLGGANCKAVISPASLSLGSGGGDRSVAISTGASCSWTASVNTSGNDWLNLTSNSTGSGDGSISISVKPNQTPVERTGTIAVAGHSLTITQAAKTDTPSTPLSPPTVKIVSPTAEANWTTTDSAIRLSGTASDNESVVKVMWRTDRASGGVFPLASGDASGTTNWMTTPITLPPGYSIITITAQNAGGLTAQAQLRILRLPASMLVPIAGNGEFQYNGESRPALATAIGSVSAMVTDNAGNICFADASNSRIRRLNVSDGTITTIAGGGSNQADNIPATEARLNYPTGLAYDFAGNLYMVEPELRKVRKISFTGIITTIAGTGATGYEGDGGQAIAAKFNSPQDVKVDRAGNIYIADTGNHAIRKVDSTTGIITTVAGTGSSGKTGDGGTATQAQLASPLRLALDEAGNIYIADTSNHAIRKVTIDTDIITTIAGTLGLRGFGGDTGPANKALLTEPGCIVFDAAGNLFISDSSITRIRKVAANTGIINTIAGDGVSNPNITPFYVLLVDRAGTLLTSGSAHIYKLLPFWLPDLIPPTIRITNPPTPTVQLTGSVGNILLEGTVDDNIQATHITWNNNRGSGGFTDIPCCGLRGWSIVATGLKPGLNIITVTAWDTAGNSASVNVSITTPGGVGPVIRTVAGNRQAGFSGDGELGAVARLWNPEGIALDSPGNLYIVDSANHRIRKVARDGRISTVAGNGTIGSSGDGGQATDAALTSPSGVAADASGNLYISDTYNNRIRKVAPDGIITTIAGTGVEGFSGDGAAATSAQLNLPYGIAVDSSGNVYFSDNNNHRVRRVGVNGIITTVAGAGYGFAGDDGQATAALLRYPLGVAVDAAGNLYVADAGNARVRKVTSTGTISTVAGNGQTGFATDGAPAISTPLGYPVAVAVDSSGNLFIGDRSQSRVHKVSPSGVLTYFAGDGGGFTAENDEGLPALSVSIGQPGGLAVDRAGNVYISEPNSNRVIIVADQQKAAAVSAASFVGQSLAAESIAAVFGSNLATTTQIATTVPLPTQLADTSVRVRDSAGVERSAALFFVSASQINFQLPPGVADGMATVLIQSGDGKISTATVNIRQTAPGLFTANANGQGVAIGQVLRIKPDGRQVYSPIAVYDASKQQFVAQPIKIEDAGERLFLILYGTGIRNHGDPAKVKVRFDGEELPVLYAGAQGGFVGLDQINIEVTQTLLNRGEVDVALSISDQAANIVRVAFGEKLCNYLVAFQPPLPNFTAFSGAGGTAIFNVTTDFDCGWYARSEASWVTPTFGTPFLSGSANVRFRVEANPGTTPRTGTVRIAGQVFTVKQESASSPDSPRLAITNPSGGTLTTAAATVDLSGTASGTPDLAFISWSNDRGGTGYVSGSSEWRVDGIPLQVSLNNITITAYDLAGRSRSVNVSITFKPEWAINGFAGGGQNPPANGVPATSVQFTNPISLAVDASNNLYIGDQTRILKVAPNGTLTIAAGADGNIFVNIGRAGGLTTDMAGNLYYADLDQNCVRKIDFAAKLAPILAGKCRGGGFAGDGGLATNAQLRLPTDTAVDAMGNLYIADLGNGRVRKVDAATGIITTIAGNGGFPDILGDGGPATAASLSPVALAFNKGGELLVASGDRIRQINLTTGIITTFAGGGSNGLGDGGLASQAMATASGLALDGAGNVFLSGELRVRRILASTKIINTIAGNGLDGDSGDGGAALLAQIRVFDVALDNAGNIYIATGTRVRKLTPFP